ncbi:MAG TPA: helix-turn-helix transcriptional regulator [Cytophagaceae bacterium]
MNFGEKIKQLREEKGYSVRELAKRAGLSKTTVSEVENNIVDNPKKETIERLAKALDVPVGLLMEEDEVLQSISEEIYKDAEFRGSLSYLSEEEKIGMIKDLMAQEPRIFYEATQDNRYIGPLTQDEYAALSAYLEIYRKSKKESE